MPPDGPFLVLVATGPWPAAAPPAPTPKCSVPPLPVAQAKPSAASFTSASPPSLSSFSFHFSLDFFVLPYCTINLQPGFFYSVPKVKEGGPEALCYSRVNAEGLREETSLGFVPEIARLPLPWAKRPSDLTLTCGCPLALFHTSLGAGGLLWPCLRWLGQSAATTVGCQELRWVGVPCS